MSYTHTDGAGAGLDISRLISAFRRRWWLVLAPALALTPIALLIAYVLPPVYSATARILIESQQIPAELARSTVTGGVAERIALIEQRLMTRQNLLDVADRFNIYAGRDDMTPTAIVDDMRKTTQIVGVRLSNQRGAPLTGVNITFTANRSSIAADVANEFLQLLLEQNVRTRNTRAVETSAFFESEVEHLTEELAKLESDLTRFKIANEKALPDSLGFRRSELSRLQAQIFERELQMAALLEQRKALIEARDSGDFGRLPMERAATPQEIELERLRRALIQQSAVYSESHPSIRSLRSRISALEASLEEAISGESDDSDSPSRDAGPMSILERQLQQIDAQMRLIEERKAQETMQVEDLQASIDQTPEIELSLSAMQRRQATLQSQLQQAQLRQAEADRGERLEINNQGERFEVIERAQRPSRPDSPNRPLIVAAGFGGGLMLGFGIVLLLELMNRSLRSSEDLVRQLNMRPLGVIPYITTPKEQNRRKWILRSLLFFILIAAPLTLLLVDLFVMPLELLGRRILSALRIDVLMTMLEQRLNR